MSSGGKRVCKRCGHPWSVHYVKTQHHGYLTCSATAGPGAFCDCPGYIDRDPASEVERLRSLLAAANWPCRQMGETHPDLQDWQREALAWKNEREAEVERLREALRRIRDECEDAYNDDGVADWQRVARAALHPDEEPS